MLRTSWILVIVCGIQSLLLGIAAWRHAPTWDEVGHLAAGISHWEFGEYSQYSVNPPLVRTIATAPIFALMQPELDWSSYQSNPRQRSEVQVGRELIENNPKRFLLFFFVARLTCIPFVLLGTVICYRWSQTIYGERAGLLAAILWAFSPMVLGHGSLITPDVASASLGAAAFFALRCWLLESTLPRLLAMAAIFSLALLSKTTWLVSLLVLPTIWALWRLDQKRLDFARPKIILDLTQLICAATLVTLLINAFYGFDGSGSPLGDYQFVSTRLAGRLVANRTTDWGNRFADTWAASVPVLLPKHYVQGVDIQSYDFEQSRILGWSSYLLGNRRVGGWWYYYFAGLAVKEPLPFILALVACLPVAFLNKQHEARRETVAILLPAIAVLIFVSSQTSLNRHVRYALPALPFLIIWTSQLATHVTHARRLTKALAVIFLVWFIGGTVYYTPHFLSYFNESVGGPMGGHRALDNSNLDWGQDLLYLRSWIDEHPEANNLRIAYFGCFDPRFLGIEYELPPPYLPPLDASLPQTNSGPEPGWFAVSANYVLGSTMNVPNGHGKFVYFSQPAFQYFSRFKPVDRAGYSIWLYHLKIDEVNQVRAELGLSLLRSK